MAMAAAAEPVQESRSSDTERGAAESVQRAGGGGGVRALVDWRKPFRTTALFAATNAVFWFVSLSPCRVVCLLGLCLAVLLLVQLMRDVVLPKSRGTNVWRSMTSSWEMVDSGQEGRSGAEAQFTDSWMSFKLFLAETSSFKQQNPGKFCLLVCSLCSFLAVLGRYIPGIVISYIIVLGIFLWPLVSSHEFGMWLDPVLQKLNFGVREFLQKIKENHEQRLLKAQTEKESIEADLSSLFPKLDSTACRELSVSDTEVSEITWTDNGTFNLSEGHTPQTENSEDLDRRSEEEVFSGGLPDFPSLDNGLGTNGDDDDLSIGLPTQGERVEGEAAAQALELVQRMAGDVITAAVTTAMQERLQAVGVPALAQALAEDTDSEAEDFELLDQSELEQLEGELGLEKPSDETQPKGTKQPGFFSKLLGRH